ncbi:MAG: hypothetical protein C4560_12535 [Nitrospiraceae bacterium]|nr:MAG: hypothetical protein C4560_12535 [Nitrospiraceae bacterium]
MTRKEYAERNIGMTFDFIRQAIDNPKILDTIPDHAELDFIDKDMPFKEKEAMKGKKVARYKVGHVFAPVRG